MDTHFKLINIITSEISKYSSVALTQTTEERYERDPAREV